MEGRQAWADEKTIGSFLLDSLELYMYIQGSPSGYGRCDIPGVTQVFEEHSRTLQCWREEIMTYHNSSEASF